MAYATLPDSQIDGDSPLIADTLFKLRDNPVGMMNGDPGAPRLQDAALSTGAATTAGRNWVGARIPAGAIRQGNISTSTGEVSTNSGSADITLPGGQYGFYPQVRSDGGSSNRFAGIVGGISYNSSEGQWWTDAGTVPTAYATRMTLGVSGGGSVYAAQRYINSSPPYNLGDGDVPLFVFALVDSAGEAVSTYAADVPPWGYNGPTRVTADVIDGSGRKFQRRCFIGPDGGVVRDAVEVTHDLKNADMHLIPHPFGVIPPGHSVVLLDPVETLDLLDLHEAGESVAELLYGRHLILDGTRIDRSAPAGVLPCAVRWKQAQMKWRAVPEIAAKASIAKGMEKRS